MSAHAPSHWHDDHHAPKSAPSSGGGGGKLNIPTGSVVFLGGALTLALSFKYLVLGILWA